MQKLVQSLLFLLASFLPATATTTGTWRLYQSFSNITEVAPASGTCFALASGSLFSYNATSGEMATYDKTNGLSDNNIEHIAWTPATKRLVIAYNNSNIDLLCADGTTVNVPDLYMKTTTKDKTINHIFIDGQYAYMSLGLGVLKLDTKRGVIADTYQLDFSIDYSYTKDGYLYAASRERGLYRGKTTDNLLDKNNWQRVDGYTPLKEDRLNVKDNTTGMWWTRNDNGKLTCYTIDTDGNRSYKTEGVLPDGPASNHFYRLYMHGGKLYSVGGNYTQEKDANYDCEVHVWNGSLWTEFEQPTEASTGYANKDFICMDFDPLKEGHVIVGAKSGLYEYQDGKLVQCFNMANSPLKSVINSNKYIIVSGVKYDNNGTLWLFNSGVDDCLWTIDRNNNWTVSPLSNKLKGIQYGYLTSFVFTNNYNRLWFVNNYWDNTRLYVYDIAADQFAYYGPSYTNEDGATIEPHYIYSINNDKDGNIWMANTNGPLYLTPADTQSGIFTQHKVPRNDGTNLADYLLANTDTRCVATDGANRKWIGTSDGVFLISEDCNTQIEHFTTENSPLMSNLVHDIAVDPNSNIVYFATDNGLCSYASDATASNDNMTKDNVYAYPNPVTADFSGKITIVGLSYNSDIKIVNTNGTLVNHGRSTGGSYHWDGRDLKGHKVASGIYMVETATEDGDKGTVCKIAIIR